MEPTVLFVDDEPNLLAGLRRMLRGSTQGWELLFATSGAEALQIVAERPVDAVVSDMRMPEMNGAQLLAAIQRRAPGAARIILSGQAEQDAVISAAGSAQQFLAKPCEADLLIAAIHRALRVRRLLADPDLRDVIGGVSSLPKPPEIYNELVTVASSPNFQLADVARIINSSVAMSAEVLKLVNTAFFGLPRRVESVTTAVSLLGMDNIKALVLASSLFQPGTTLPPGIDPAELQRLGLCRAALAKRLASLEALEPHEMSMVVLAAVLRDVGLLILGAAMPDRIALLCDPDPDDGATRALEDSDSPSARAEREIVAFGCTVPQAGAHLLALWGFPDLVVHALACQPLAEDDVAAGAAEHVLAAADRRAVWPDQPLLGSPGGYLDVERAQRWNAACDRALDSTDDDPAEEAAA